MKEFFKRNQLMLGVYIGFMGVTIIELLFNFTRDRLIGSSLLGVVVIILVILIYMTDKEKNKNDVNHAKSEGDK